MIFATPTFEVNSVNVPSKKHTKASITMGGRWRSGIRASPIRFAMQDATLPREIAKPPPKRNIRLHGILVSITFHVIKPSDDLFGLLAAATYNFGHVITEVISASKLYLLTLY